MIKVLNQIWFVLLFIGIVVGPNSQATTVVDTVYINSGSMMAVDSTFMPYFSFNSSSVFDRENKRLILSTGDTMMLTVINTDSISHGFDIKHYSNVETVIPGLNTVEITFSFDSPGAYIYYDYTNAESYRYMGLAGMIIAENIGSTATSFFWNIKDHQKTYNETLAQGLSVDWALYYPEYFTINGNSNPHINDDANARVVGLVGDTIHIYMVNTGQSLHSLHYHGYHSEIFFSSKFPNHVGRIKDTFSIYSMEAVMVELIPHQPGEYPVHDHNLVAVSGGNIYPNGMFVTMLIDQ